jgi:predicted nucleotidyltransferase
MDENIPYIDKIVPIIVSLASPDQIILFGSYARGDNTDKSDIDSLRRVHTPAPWGGTEGMYPESDTL